MTPHRIAAVLLALACSGPVVAQEKGWKQGTWTTPADEQTYAIETERDILVLSDPTPQATRSFSPVAGDPVKYISGTPAAHLRVVDDRTGEHALVLVRQRPKYSASYPAVGPGHFIKSVAPGGASLVLEDGSRWDIDPMVRFSVSDWETNEMISIRRSTDDPGYAFEIDNTSRDDGALANYRTN